jgi:hypothetical protein
MDPNLFSQYIDKEILLFIPALWFISVILRNTPRVPDWSIPYILLMLAILGSVMVLVEIHIVARIVQGILAAAVAILGNVAAKEIISGTMRKGNNKGGGER